MLLEEEESWAKDKWRILYSLATTTIRHSEAERPTRRAEAIKALVMLFLCPTIMYIEDIDMDYVF